MVVPTEDDVSVEEPPQKSSSDRRGRKRRNSGVDEGSEGGGHAAGRAVKPKRRKRPRPPFEPQHHGLFYFITSLGFLLQSSFFLYQLMYVSATVLGNVVHPFFYAFHLLSVVEQYEELRIVLRSVTTPIRALALTGLLFVLLTHYFAMFGFAYIRSDYESIDGDANQTECRTLLMCLASTFDYGLKNDGGVGGGLTQLSANTAPLRHYLGRLLFDSSYNVVLLIILLNVTFGLIIDTFAFLREKNQAQKHDMQNVCYICSIERSMFDRHTKRGFEFHVRNDHWKWNYVFLAAHLMFKPRTERTGVEEYLWHRIHRQDASFFPLHRALVLQDVNTEEDEADQLRNELRQVREEMAAMRRQVRHQIMHLEKAVRDVGAHAAEPRSAQDRRASMRAPSPAISVVPPPPPQ